MRNFVTPKQIRQETPYHCLQKYVLQNIDGMLNELLQILMIYDNSSAHILDTSHNDTFDHAEEAIIVYNLYIIHNQNSKMF